MKQVDRLRAFALASIDGRSWTVNDQAVCALAEDADPTQWTPWQTTRAESGQWFLWRDPAFPDELHADQVEPSATGFIKMKHGCGLDFYPECQAAQLADDVRAAIAAAEHTHSLRGPG